MEEKVCLFQSINAIAADGLAMEVDSTSATIMLA